MYRFISYTAIFLVVHAFVCFTFWSMYRFCFFSIFCSCSICALTGMAVICAWRHHNFHLVSSSELTKRIPKKKNFLLFAWAFRYLCHCINWRCKYKRSQHIEIGTSLWCQFVCVCFFFLVLFRGKEKNLNILNG